MANENKKEQKCFSISYDMKETAEHRIDGEVLGNSILGLTRAIKRSDKLINGENSEITVEVKAHKEGSFTIDFVTWYQAGGADVLTALGLGAVGFAAAKGTVLGVIKEIQSRKITARVKRGNNSVLELDDGTELECPNTIADIVADQEIRKFISDVVSEPIRNNEGARFVLKDENGVEFDALESVDAVSFSALPRNTLTQIEETTSQMTVKFSQLNFDGPTGWRCILPNGRDVSVRINDKAFLKRIEDGNENFVKGDAFLVKLTEKTTIKPDGESATRYSIVEVIRPKKK